MKFFNEKFFFFLFVQISCKYFHTDVKTNKDLLSVEQVLDSVRLTYSVPKRRKIKKDYVYEYEELLSYQDECENELEEGQNKIITIATVNEDGLQYGEKISYQLTLGEVAGEFLISQDQEYSIDGIGFDISCHESLIEITIFRSHKHNVEELSLYRSYFYEEENEKDSKVYLKNDMQNSLNGEEIISCKVIKPKTVKGKFFKYAIIKDDVVQYAFKEKIEEEDEIYDLMSFQSLHAIVFNKDQKLKCFISSKKQSLDVQILIYTGEEPMKALENLDDKEGKNYSLINEPLSQKEQDLQNTVEQYHSNQMKISIKENNLIFNQFGDEFKCEKQSDFEANLEKGKLFLTKDELTTHVLNDYDLEYHLMQNEYKVFVSGEEMSKCFENFFEQNAKCFISKENDDYYVLIRQQKTDYGIFNAKQSRFVYQKKLQKQHFDCQGSEIDTKEVNLKIEQLDGTFRNDLKKRNFLEDFKLQEDKAIYFFYLSTVEDPKQSCYIDVIKVGDKTAVTIRVIKTRQSFFAFSQKLENSVYTINKIFVDQRTRKSQQETQEFQIENFEKENFYLMDSINKQIRHVNTINEVDQFLGIIPIELQDKEDVSVDFFQQDKIGLIFLFVDINIKKGTKKFMEFFYLKNKKNLFLTFYDFQKKEILFENELHSSLNYFNWDIFKLSKEPNMKFSLNQGGYPRNKMEWPQEILNLQFFDNIAINLEAVDTMSLVRQLNSNQ